MENLYDGWHADVYDVYTSEYTGLTSEKEFYCKEAAISGSPVLELGCGTGRVTIPIAQGGIDITGIDKSVDMLKIAQKKSAEIESNLQDKITLVEGDMRSFELDRRYKLIIIPFRAFLHLITIEDQKSCLKQVKKHLESDGRFIMNIFDPSLKIISEHQDSLGESLKFRTEFVHPVTGNRVICWDSRKYRLSEQIIEQRWIYDEIDSDGELVRRVYTDFELRYIYRYEMQHLLESVGFEIEYLYGDFNYGKFTHGGEQVWVCRKR